LDKCIEGQTPYYLIRWKNYSPENDTWESVHNLANAKKVLQDYEGQGQPSIGVRYHVMTVTEDRAGKTPPTDPAACILTPGLIPVSLLSEGPTNPTAHILTPGLIPVSLLSKRPSNCTTG
jgi:hypothetical protein